MTGMPKANRKYYIDNLRWMAVFLLFPYHTFMIYNSYGENFYVKGVDIVLTTGALVVTWPWFMPLMFVIAGISTACALQRRSIRQYIRERFLKLFVPLFFGILLLAPGQTYFAERFHNGYTGGYLEQYLLFFTKPTDMTGYEGGFTTGHLWFILYLFLISLAAALVIFFLQRNKREIRAGALGLPALSGLFLCPLIGALVPDIAGKSLGEYFAYFMLGYLVLSSEEVIGKIDAHRFVLLGISAVSMLLVLFRWMGILTGIPDIVFDIFFRFYAWITILALVGIGRHSLNFKNEITDYFSCASFSVYMFHQTWLVCMAYYVFEFTTYPALQICLILILSILATFASYELCRRMKITRFMFGIKE